MKPYGKVHWHDERSHYDFIDKLFFGLGKHFNSFIDTTYEIPYAYSERTFVGHLAQSASINEYHSIQEYNVNTRDVKKGKKAHYVPDLHVWIPRGKNEPDSCVFEVKTTYPIPIDKDPSEYVEIAQYELDEANNQIDQHGLIEAKYRCALVATPIHCAPTKWIKYAKTPRIYHKVANKLRTELINSMRDSTANFAWSYMLDYENVIRLAWKADGKEYLPWIGIICMGKVGRYKS
ncbi:hypothetical protein ACFLXG_05265 [Chloroflexota bacterium]